MKKINVRSGLCGFMAGVIATYAIPVVAQQVTKNIQVSYKNIKIYADGKLVNTDSNNEAFIYNGTTYLPVRAVGEAFNKAINWNGQTSSVYIGTMPLNTGSPAAYLTELEHFTKTISIRDMMDSGKDNIGNIHETGYRFDDQAGEVQYLLNGKYRIFTGTVGLPYGRRDTGYEGMLKIYGDGKILYSSPIITGGVQPVAFNIDVTGVLNLKIEVDESWTDLHLYDGKFYA